MITRQVNIKGWVATFLFSIHGHNEREVLARLLNCAPPKDIYDDVADKLEANQPNEGFTYSNTKLRESLVYIGPTTSGAEFLSSFVHELAHLVCDICLTKKISLKGEKIAYMQGDIATQLSDIVCYLSCDHCRDA